MASKWTKMDESSDEDCSTHPNRARYRLYRDRPEWRDVVPVPQNDGPNPIVSIAYSEKFKDVYDYFRAILRMQEKSDRALALTEDALDLNTANYTVWQYRRQILKDMKKDLGKELEYISRMINEHPKNYQVWHHRRIIVEWKQDPTLELGFTEQILVLEAKNYHAWQHRQWVIQYFNLYENELEYTEKLLTDDVRNNSAWNQRYFIISKTTGFNQETINREVDFVCAHIKNVTQNESSWNYLRGILQHNPRTLDSHVGVRDMCEQLFDDGNRSPYLLSFLIDLLVVRLKEDSDPEAPSRIERLCDLLADEFDTMRTHYWKYLKSQLVKNDNEDQMNYFDEAAAMAAN